MKAEETGVDRLIAKRIDQVVDPGRHKCQKAQQMKLGVMALIYLLTDPTDRPSAGIHLVARPPQNPRGQAEIELPNSRLAQEYQGRPKPQELIQGGLEAPEELK